MIPLYVDGCFAVLHPAAGRRGALICGTLSDDALNAYRPLCFLAEQLAAAGIPTLRLAFRGTGDSAGSDDEAGRFDQWLDNIRTGAAWLREHCNVDSVTVVGHRVGASLAARAAGNTGAIDSLALLNPVSGRQFLHELTLAARISQRVWGTDHKVDDGAWFESHGLRIDHPTRNALQTLDLRKLPARPAAQVLLFETEPRQAALAQVEALQSLGTSVTFEAHASLARMQRDLYEAELPRTAFDSILGWMQALPAKADAPVPPRPIIETILDTGVGRETPIHFGADDALFGILSTPAWVSPESPAVLLINTSANPRWGNGRIAVEIARALAADGVASLRMDAAGMGDAAPQTGEVGRPYAEATTQDVLQAVAELARRTQRPVVVFGACSGAYHAWQAACRDVHVAGMMLVNLQRFVWREGDPSDMVRRTDLRPTAFYLRNILDPRSWYRLIRADFDVARLIRVILMRVLRRAVAGLDPLLSAVSGGATPVGRVRKAMRALGGRGLPILYLLARNDPGVEELAAYFGRDGWRLRRQPNASVRMLEGADHTLSNAKVREALIQHIRAWCQEHWQTQDKAVFLAPPRAMPVTLDARTPRAALKARLS